MTKEKIRENKIYKTLKSICETGEYNEKTPIFDFLDLVEFEIQTDSPYTDDWKTHGYDSYEEWFNEHRDYVEYLDEVSLLYKEASEKIPGYEDHKKTGKRRNPFDIMDEVET